MCVSSTKVITAADSFQQFYLFYSGVENNSGLHAYAPTRDALDETKNDFYTELQTVTSAIATRDFLIVAGDFNARKRPKDQITSKVIGNFGLGQHCENGERLVNYALMNQLTRWRSSFQDSLSYKGADTGLKSGSDHKLIITKILLRLAACRKNKRKPRIDSSKLKDETVKHALSLGLTNRFDALDCDSLSVEDKWGQFKPIISATAGKFLGNTKVKRQHWISVNILSLVEQRNNLTGPIILLNRFTSAQEKNTRKNQAGFRLGRGCIDNIFGARLIIQHFQRYNLPLALIFLEDTAALNSVTHHKPWKTLEINETPVKFIELNQAYYSESTSRIRIYGKEPEEFLVESTVKKGCVLSPMLFNYCIGWVLENTLMQRNGAQL
ncbi:hypothetical protein QYM36_009080 [Artemia franciscana]|uniref:Reverse transcriptase domain-containing protein n=1 Tax=Artemia franciscana TaxID=6661 RepID=A0AA88HT85_ARTSF|nr:hypothetical protein QYM36_009080 [Artemia franciscana]